MKSLTVMGRVIVLGAVALTLVIPKLMLIAFFKTSMGLPFGLRTALRMLPQDILLAVAAFSILLLVTRRPTVLRFILCALVTTAILCVLLIDTRIRELWLRPLSWGLARYYWAYSTELSSGTKVFFNQRAGLGITFRRWCFYVFVLHFTFWLAAIWYLRRELKAKAVAPVAPLRLRRPLVVMSVAMVSLLAISWRPSTAIYQADENIFTRWLTTPFQSHSIDGSQLQQAASAFEQPLRPLADAIGQQPHLYPKKPAPFQNLVLVILESQRWNGLNIEIPAETPAPTLAKLASEGLLVKCYVSLPHSSKAQFAILTGRYPHLGLEIREAMRQHWPSIFWPLRRQRGAKTYCFSAQGLVFENTSGMLGACGIQKRFGPPELSHNGAGKAKLTSSFGGDDALLLGMPTSMVAQAGSPFAAVLLTSSSHYPYNYPGKIGERTGIGNYFQAIAYTDRVISHLLEEYGKHDLLRDTLFVFVGDHGESFGEHGTLIHNNSMYEEELAVPLVFWSADGRLRRSGTLVGRQIDIAPTIADLMAIDDPSYQVQGQSLVRQRRPEPLYAGSFFGDVSKAILWGSDKFIYFPSDDRLLHFDLAADPEERRPLRVSLAKRGEIIRRLQAFDAYQELSFPRIVPQSLMYDQAAGAGQ
jgi:phosphoglycerol transferase MdoB-like AlkP superfamily enzyme